MSLYSALTYSPLSPPLHGALGVWDEIIFGVGFVLSILIFVALAFNDRKRDVHKEMTSQDDQDA
jgi:hypothetical protein